MESNSLLAVYFDLFHYIPSYLEEAALPRKPPQE